MLTNELKPKDIQCPYCGETITVILDCSIEHQRYIEDCQVCCRPITLDVAIDRSGENRVFVSHEDD